MKFITIIITNFLIINLSISQDTQKFKYWGERLIIDSAELHIESLAKTYKFDSIIVLAESYIKGRKEIYISKNIETEKIKNKLFTDLVSLYSSSEFYFISKNIEDSSDALYVKTLKSKYFKENVSIKQFLEWEYEKAMIEYNVAGVCCKKRNDTLNSRIKHLNNCIELDPNNTLYYFKRAELYLIVDDKTKFDFLMLAKKDYEKCIYLAPNRYYYYRELSNVNSLLKDTTGEKAELNKAIRYIKLQIKILNDKYEILELKHTLFFYYLDIEDYKNAKILLDSLYYQVKNETIINCTMIDIILMYNKFNSIESFNKETKTWTFIKNGVKINCNGNISELSKALSLAFTFVPNYQKFHEYCTDINSKNIFEK